MPAPCPRRRRSSVRLDFAAVVPNEHLVEAEEKRQGWDMLCSPVSAGDDSTAGE